MIEFLIYQAEVRETLEKWYTKEEAHRMSHLYVVAEGFMESLTVEDVVFEVLQSNKPNYTPKWKRITQKIKGSN